MTTGATGSTLGRLCVDASLVLRLVLPYERTPDVAALWNSWVTTEIEVVAPVLRYGEVTSVLRLRVTTGQLGPDEGEEALQIFNDLGVSKLDRDDLHIRAWQLAVRYNQRRVYDMMYVALAELENVELWTVDERLVNTLHGRDPRLRTLATP